MDQRPGKAANPSKLHSPRARLIIIGPAFFGSSRITGDRARSASPSLSTPGRLAGETLVPTLAAQTVLRVRQGKAAHAAHVSIWPTAAPLVRNSPRGWTPRSLTTIRWSGRRAVTWRRRRPRPTMLPRALARPTRTSALGRVFGAHPRGEFRTSGAAVGQ
jgi:hypothetical protein